MFSLLNESKGEEGGENGQSEFQTSVSWHQLCEFFLHGSAPCLNTGT